MFELIIEFLLDMLFQLSLGKFGSKKENSGIKKENSGIKKEKFRSKKDDSGTTKISNARFLKVSFSSAAILLGIYSIYLLFI